MCVYLSVLGGMIVRTSIGAAAECVGVYGMWA